MDSHAVLFTKSLRMHWFNFTRCWLILIKSLKTWCEVQICKHKGFNEVNWGATNNVQLNVPKLRATQIQNHTDTMLMLLMAVLPDICVCVRRRASYLCFTRQIWTWTNSTCSTQGEERTLCDASVFLCTQTHFGEQYENTQTQSSDLALCLLAEW